MVKNDVEYGISVRRPGGALDDSGKLSNSAVYTWSPAFLDAGSGRGD